MSYIPQNTKGREPNKHVGVSKKVPNNTSYLGKCIVKEKKSSVSISMLFK